jgi:hypothetical protein
LPLAQSILVLSKIRLGFDTAVPQAVAAIALPPLIKKQKEQQRKNNFTNFLFNHIFLFFAAPVASRRLPDRNKLFIIYFYY